MGQNDITYGVQLSRIQKIGGNVDSRAQEPVGATAPCVGWGATWVTPATARTVIPGAVSVCWTWSALV